jgi:hypothetical protein
VQLAAGPVHLVEMVNLGGEILTKTGQSLSTFSLYTFPFTIPTSDRISDPRVIYDSESGRWFASILDITNGSFQLALSQSADPTGPWYHYTIAGAPAGDYPDQPTLGVSTNLVAVGGNDFTISGNTYQGGQFWVINKAELMTASSTHYAWWGPSCGFLCTYQASIHPARSLSASPTQYFVSTGAGSTNALTLYSITGTPPGTVTSSSQVLPISYLSKAPAALQKGSANALDTGDGRVLDAVWSNGNLWASFDDGCTFVGDTQPRSCFRLIELNTGALSVTIDQDWGNPGVYYLDPALSLDSLGDMTVIAGYSSATQYPGLFTYGQAYDEPGSLEPGASLPGLAPSGPLTYASCSGTCRYGDYFGASSDPSGASVWVAGEYGAAGALWSTYIGNAVTLPFSVSEIRAFPRSTDVGQAATFSVSASGGTSGYRYDWSGLPSGCASANQPSISCTATGDGSFGITVTAIDSYGTSRTTPVLWFTVYPDPMVAAPTAVPGSGRADVGQIVGFSTSASGGSGGYSFVWIGLPGCVSSNLSSISCATSLTGSFSVQVFVTDSNGFGVASASLSYAVLTDPVVSAPVSSQAALDVGQSVNLSVRVTGGSGSYTYLWNHLPTDCSGTGATAPCFPSSAGVFNVSVTIRDSNGFTVTSTESTVTVSPRLIASLTAHPNSFLQGQAMTFSGTAQGGLPGYSYLWSGLPPGCIAPAVGTNLSCTPSAAGSYRIVLTVTDQNGASVDSTAQVVVEASIFGLPALDVYASFAASTTAVIAVAAVLVRRRRRKRAA